MSPFSRILIAAVGSAALVLPVAATSPSAEAAAPATSARPHKPKPKPKPPVITKVKPRSGPVSGGTKVVIKGQRLNGTKKVIFGGTRGPGLKVKGQHKLTVYAPAHRAGRVNIRVVSNHGKSKQVRADRFTYQPLPLPVVSAISPTSGSSAGGTTVTVTGSGFTSVRSVTFGSTPATSVAVTSATQLTATAPAHPNGVVDVRVATPYGVSPVSAADQYTYNATVPAGLGGIDAPLPPGAAVPTNVNLRSVACAAPGLCQAVGQYAVAGNLTRPLAEQLAGGQWTPSALPVPSDAAAVDTMLRLSSVACPATNLCLAVGNYKSTSGQQLPLLEKWDGATWTNVPYTRPTGTIKNVLLRQVTCVSVTACYAVGEVTTPKRPLVLTWDGATWTATPSVPVPSGGSNGTLNGVACLSATDCTGVGDFRGGTPVGTRPLIVRFGAGTPTASSPDLPANAQNVTPSGTLQAVDCVPNAYCASVGSYLGNNVGTQPLSVYRPAAGQWAATSAQVTLPASARMDNGQDGELTDVDCIGTGSCWAGGSYLPTTGSSHAMDATITATSGTAAEQPTPTAVQTDQRALVELVACAGPGGCSVMGPQHVSSGSVAFLGTIAGGVPQPAVTAPYPAGATTSNLNGLTLDGSGTGVSVGQYVASGQTRGLLVTGVPVGTP